MEFSSRNNVQRSAARPATAANDPLGLGPEISKKSKLPKGFKGGKLLSTVLFVSALVLAVALIVSIATRSNEQGYVDGDNYQVVALVDKQAYFGKITDITDNYIVLSDVYYIQGSSDQNATDATNTTLVKRGCEIHKPSDKMIVYRDQINFWENLQKDGKVAEAIGQYKADNKDGQDCSKQTTQTTQQPTTDTAPVEESAPTSTNRSTTSQPSSSNTSSNSNATTGTAADEDNTDAPTTNP